MKKATKINIIIITFTLVCAIVIPYLHSKAASQFKSQGKIIFTNGTSTTKDDVIFDAEDFQRLAEVCR